jgi:hypothetical protein
MQKRKTNDCLNCFVPFLWYFMATETLVFFVGTDHTISFEGGKGGNIEWENIKTRKWGH